MIYFSCKWPYHKQDNGLSAGDYHRFKAPLTIITYLSERINLIKYMNKIQKPQLLIFPSFLQDRNSLKNITDHFYLTLMFDESLICRRHEKETDLPERSSGSGRLWRGKQTTEYINVFTAQDAQNTGWLISSDTTVVFTNDIYNVVFMLGSELINRPLCTVWLHSILQTSLELVGSGAKFRNSGAQSGHALTKCCVMLHNRRRGAEWRGLKLNFTQLSTRTRIKRHQKYIIHPARRW